MKRHGITFRSKVSYSLLALITFIIAVCAIPFIIIPEIRIIGLSIICIVALIITDTYCNTKYIIEGNILKICTNMFVKAKEYNINDIIGIKETRTWTSSPALSFDRIEIKLYNEDGVIVSPKNKDEFIKCLCHINKNIMIN